MAETDKQADRRVQHLKEVEASQASIRDTVPKTAVMLRHADKMRRRHQKEREDDEKSD